MTPSQALSYQKQLVAFLRAPPAHPNHHTSRRDLESQLEEGGRHLDAYVESYWGRLTGTLADTLFAPVSVWLGRDFTCALLGQHFENHPPTSRRLEHAAHGVHLTAQQLDPCAPFPWLPPLLELCLGRDALWDRADEPQVHHGSAPIVDPEKVFLKASCFVHSQVSDLFAIWEAGQDESLAPPADISTPLGVLLVKVAPAHCLAFAVPSALAPLAKSLASGVSLAAALDTLPEDEDLQAVAECLPHWLQKLQGAKAFWSPSEALTG